MKFIMGGGPFQAGPAAIFPTQYVGSPNMKTESITRSSLEGTFSASPIKQIRNYACKFRNANRQLVGEGGLVYAFCDYKFPL